MSADEDVGTALLYGSSLSIARDIHRTGKPPKIGQVWDVEVFLIEETEHLRASVDRRDFQFGIIVTPDHIASANQLREKIVSSQGPWAVRIGSRELWLYDPAPVVPFRFLPSDLEKVIRLFDDWFTDRLVRRDAVLVDYLCKYWIPHVPSGRSEDYYRGECHALLFVVTLLERTVNRMDEELSVLHLALSAMLAASSEFYFGRTRPRWDLDRDGSIPGALLSCQLGKFDVTLEEAAKLIHMVDARSVNWVARPLSDMQDRDSKRIRTLYIEPGDTGDCYKGIVHGLRLAAQTIDVFRVKLFAQSPPTMESLDMALPLWSAVAAKYWLEQSGVEAQKPLRGHRIGNKQFGLRTRRDKRIRH